MRALARPALLIAACAASTFVASEASAVVVGTGDNASNTTAPAGVAGFNNVGTVNGASGVYLGSGYVLTAAHVGKGNFSVGGNTYNPTAANAVQLHNPDDNSLTDLVIFQLQTSPALPALTLASSTPAAGAAVTMVGYGVIGAPTTTFYNRADVPDGDPNNNPDYVYTPSGGSGQFQGFTVGSSGGTKHYGTNAVENLGGGTTLISVTSAQTGLAVTSLVTDFYDSSNSATGGTATEGQAGLGDSGGAFFNSNNELIGVIHSVGTYEDQPSNLALFGNRTYAADIATYRDEILSTIPEPATAALLLAGLPLLGGRRQRRR